MSKAHRGKGLKDTESKGRGLCPLCKRDAVKVLFEHEQDGAKLKICKVCKAKLANAKAKSA